jgi:hypothetical protein
MRSIAMLLPALVALQVGVQPALAWAWPVDGPVLRPFILGDDPYAGGQHRGIDVGASASAPVRAPAPGTISFAGSVPGGGKTLTIRTADGYAVTLLHLGSYDVSRGDAVGEGDRLGSVASSGAPAEPQPYVYLGVRKADDPQGYVDPLGLLPEVAPAEAPVPPPEPAPVPVPAPTAQGATDAPAEAHQARPAHTVVRHTRVPATGSERATAAPVAKGQERFQHTAPHRSVARMAREKHWRSSRTHAPARDAGTVRSAVSSATIVNDGAITRSWLFVAFAGGVFGLAAVLAGRRRELGNAGPADRAAPVLLQPVPAATEDAHRLWLRKQNHVVLHRDLERILLGERKALPDLDRDHDPAEIVDVTDDPRSRRSSGRARRGDGLGCSVRPHGSIAPRSLGTVWSVSPRNLLSNHSPRRARVASFV